MSWITLEDALNNGLNISKPIVGSMFMITELGGYAVKIKNKTGAPSVKGSLVSVSSGTAVSVALQTNEYDTIGIMYDNGVPNGSDCFVITTGMAQVLWKDSTASTMGRVALADATDGRAIDIDVPSSNPIQAEHFKEIGHVMETQAGGTNVLVKCMIHFN
jgi:hypothetical protein